MNDDMQNPSCDDATAVADMYHSIAEIIPYGIWLMDTEGRFTYVSPSFEDMLGRPLEEVAAGGWADLIHADERDSAVASWKETFAARRPWSAQMRILSSGGQYRRIMCLGKPLYRGDGTFRGYGGVHVDVTEQQEQEERIARLVETAQRQLADLQQAQKELAASEDRYRTIGELMPYGIWSTDDHYILTYVSQNLLNLLGATAEDVREHAWDKFLHPDDRNTLRDRARISAAEAEAYFSAEVRVRRKDGQWHWLLVRGIPVRDDEGMFSGYLGVSIDIHELKQAQHEREQALSLADRERRLLQTIINHMPGGVVVVVAPEGRILVVNQPVRDLRKWLGDVGDSVEEVIARSQVVINGVIQPPEQWAVVQALREGVTTTDRRVRLESASGERILSVYAQPVRDDEGRIIAATMSFFDITEQIHAEEELRRHRDHLEELVAERTVSLQAANVSLQQEILQRQQLYEELQRNQESLRASAAELAMAEQRERQTLAAAIHDSVGQTLAFTRMKLGMLRQNCLPENAAMIHELDEMIQKAISETRSMTVELAPPVLVQMGLEPALEWLGSQMQSKHGYEVQFSDDGQYKPIDNETKITLYHATRELLINVAKHAGASTVWISLSRQDDSLRVMVADDGQGFDVESVKGPHGDSFGLFNIHERIAHLGGNMTIQSGPGQGACFEIIVPLAA